MALAVTSAGLRVAEFWESTPREFFACLRYARAARRREAHPLAVLTAAVWNAWYKSDDGRPRSVASFMVDPPPGALAAEAEAGEADHQAGLAVKLAALRSVWGGTVTTSQGGADGSADSS